MFKRCLPTLRTTDRKLVGAVELFEDVTEHRRQVHNFDGVKMERIAHVQWDTNWTVFLRRHSVRKSLPYWAEFGYLTS